MAGESLAGATRRAFGIASRCKGICALPAIIPTNVPTSAPVKSIVVSSRSTKHRARIAFDALRGSGGPTFGTTRPLSARI